MDKLEMGGVVRVHCGCFVGNGIRRLEYRC
ncbi:MAG: hypothetical protein QG656_1384 [Candidatus Hydrogenedentes bacterium]|nr:hypothetical protein [Candidatus Hydrogenedentota bacterium]